MSSVTTLKTRKTESIKSDSGLKPMNFFYIWYGELCRRFNMQPLSNVKSAKPKNETLLDFVVDKIKPEEWTPIINALKCDTSLHVIAIRSRVSCPFLHDVDTEEKAKTMKRRAGSLYTTFIFKSVLKSLGNLIRKNNVLSALELDGLPIGIEYIEGLIEALKRNKTIKVLTIKRCTLRDLGCQIICNALKEMPNIQILNLSTSGLSSLSGEYIAKVIKYQQLNRYCESWHNSLRYEDPEDSVMAGLKRITLNNNPLIGDEGLNLILNELEDDLWIKALDMQRCGITEMIASRLINVVTQSKLEVADFRNNEQLEAITIEKILDILKDKQEFGNQPEFQWCMTATSISNITDRSSIVSSNPLTKSKSGFCKIKVPSNTTTNITNPSMRRIKTCTNIPSELNKKPDKIKSLTIQETKKDSLVLNRELQNEMQKRKESEMENKKLKAELEKIKSMSNLSTPTKTVKFDRIENRKIKRVKAKSAKPAGKQNVEFVFENNNSQVFNIMQNIAEQTPKDDSDNENELSYYKDIIEDETLEVTQESSNNELINFLNEIKNTKDENGSQEWLSTKLTSCFLNAQ